jgi:hypothetical protein
MNTLKTAGALFLLFFILAGNTGSQVTQTLRVIYHETQEDGIDKIVVDNSGNIYAASHVSDNQGTRILTTKFDPAGNVVWRKKYRGPAFEDRIAGIELDDQGNCVVGGFSEGIDGVFHFLLIKYSAANGDSLFVKRRAKVGEAYAFSRDTQGNLYLAGDEQNSGIFGYCVVKYNSSGDTIWSALHSGSSIRTMDIDASGNVYVSGDVFSNSCYTIKYNSSGVQQWANTTNLFMGPTPLGMKLLKTDSQGNTYVTGYRYINTTTREDIVLIKYNAAGVMEWERRFINDGRNDYTNSLTLDNAGNIIVAGNSYNSAEVSYDLLLLKYDPAGNLLWSRFFPKAGAHAMKPSKVICDAQNNIYSSGGQNECFLVKYNSLGDTLWSIFTKGDANSGLNNINDLKLDASGNIYCGGLISNVSNGRDIIMLRYSQSLVGISNETITADKFILSQNYPNPFNPSTGIEFLIPENSLVNLAIYDAAGKEIEVLVSEFMNSGQYKYDWNAAGYPSGVYFYRLTAGKYSEVRKMVLVK